MMQRMKLPKSILCLGSALVLASCADSSGGDSTKTAGATAQTALGPDSTGNQKAARLRSGDMGDDDSGSIIKKYATDYTGASTGDENKKFALDGKSADGGKKEYKTKDYKTKSFWGDKDYAKKVYAGNTDGSRFMKASNLSDKSAQDATKSFATKDYATKDYATNSARETRKADIARPSDAETDARMRVFKKPDIISEQQAKDLNVQAVRDMLGRKD
jgi:hypothetical protein